MNNNNIMSSAQGKKGGKGRYFKKNSGPPKGGDGTGEFKGTAMTQYRSQPLVRISSRSHSDVSSFLHLSCPLPLSSSAIPSFQLQ